MRNYFSRLAKQSGLRFSEQKVNPRVSADDGKNKPLHNEETIFVSSPENRFQPAEKRGDKTAQTNQQTKANKENTENQSTVEIMPPQIVEQKAVVETSLPETTTIEFKNQPEIIEVQPEKTSPIVEEISFSEISPETSPIFSEPENPSLSETKPSLPQKDSLLSEKREIFSNEFETPLDVTEINVEKETERKMYFEKTEKILEEGGISKEETGRTILQEIQQWVADAPILEKSEDVPTAEKTIKIISSPEAKAENFDAGEDEKQTQISVLEEQNLNLSIGKISVHIEGGGEISRPEVLPANNSTRTNERKSERSFSRLSRYYL